MENILENIQAFIEQLAVPVLETAGTSAKRACGGPFCLHQEGHPEKL